VPELGGIDFVAWEADFFEVRAFDFLFGFAVWADGADEALGEDGFDRGGDEEGFDAHIDEAGEGGRGVVGVEGAEDEVAREGGADGDFGGFEVADFADHDDVGILAEDMAEAHGEGEADIGADGDLVDAFEFVFDGFFDGDDSFLDGVDGAEEGVEGGGFAGACGACDEEDAVRFEDDVAYGFFVFRGEAELIEAEEDFATGEEAEGDAFAVDGGDGGDADIDFLAFDADVDAAVLGEAFFGDIHAGHDFDAGEDGGLVTFKLGGHRGLVEDAVDAVTDAEFVFGGFEVDIGGAVFEGFPDDLVDEFDDAGFLVGLGDFFFVADEEFEGFVFGEFVEGFGADAVIFFERFFDFGARSEGEFDWAAGVEANGVEHGGVEGVTDGDLEGIVFEASWDDGMLEGDFGGDALLGFGWDGESLEIEAGPVESVSDALEEEFFGEAAFSGEEGEPGFLGTVFGSDEPGFTVGGKLFRSCHIRLGEHGGDRGQRHESGDRFVKSIYNAR
jgi:hypothetical protein